MCESIPVIDVPMKVQKVETRVRKLQPGYRFNNQGVLEKLVDGKWCDYYTLYCRAHEE